MAAWVSEDGGHPPTDQMGAKYRNAVRRGEYCYPGTLWTPVEATSKLRWRPSEVVPSRPGTAKGGVPPRHDGDRTIYWGSSEKLDLVGKGGGWTLTEGGGPYGISEPGSPWCTQPSEQDVAVDPPAELLVGGILYRASIVQKRHKTRQWVRSMVSSKHRRGYQDNERGEFADFVEYDAPVVAPEIKDFTASFGNFLQEMKRDAMEAGHDVSRKAKRRRLENSKPPIP